MTLLRLTTLTALIVSVSLPAFAQPAAATLIAPSADVAGTTIAFSWQSATGATWYQFWLGRPNTTLVTEHWYTAEHAGCAAGGVCTITLTPAIDVGSFIWHIRTWGPSGYGVWSPATLFTVTHPTHAWAAALPASRRFSVVLGGEAVLDNETGLVWQRSWLGTLRSWNETTSICAVTKAGGRGGWRLPTLSELLSVFETDSTGTHLPPGHPFTSSVTAYHWTATRTPSGSDFFGVHWPGGTAAIVVTAPTAAVMPIICVRGGSSTHQ
jgi:hypothetical protein